MLFCHYYLIFLNRFSTFFYILKTFTNIHGIGRIQTRQGNPIRHFTPPTLELRRLYFLTYFTPKQFKFLHRPLLLCVINMSSMRIDLDHIFLTKISIFVFWRLHNNSLYVEEFHSTLSLVRVSNFRDAFLVYIILYQLC